MMLGWFDEKFVPLLAETVSYKVNVLGNLTELSMNYSSKKQNDRPGLHLVYRYFSRDPDNISDATWTEALVWNPHHHSFDEINNTQEMQEKTQKIQSSISKTRQFIKNADVSSLCTDFLEQSGIMSILPGERGLQPLIDLKKSHAFISGTCKDIS
jgi:hypothetical protein